MNCMPVPAPVCVCDDFESRSKCVCVSYFIYTHIIFFLRLPFYIVSVCMIIFNVTFDLGLFVVFFLYIESKRQRAYKNVYMGDETNN